MELAVSHTQEKPRSIACCGDKNREWTESIGKEIQTDQGPIGGALDRGGSDLGDIFDGVQQRERVRIHRIDADSLIL